MRKQSKPIPKPKRAKKSGSVASAPLRTAAPSRKGIDLCLIPSQHGGKPRSRGRAGPPPPIGGRLREVRLRKNLTLGDIEALCGISEPGGAHSQSGNGARAPM